MATNVDMKDTPTIFVMYLEGKMESLLGMTPSELQSYSSFTSSPEVGEGGAPTKALLFKGGTISVISGRSGDLFEGGYEPYPESHLNTQNALAITQAFATLHATLRVRDITKLDTNPPELEEEYEKNEWDLRDSSEYYKDGKIFYDSNTKNIPTAIERDDWTCQITQPSLVSSNLSILCSNFRNRNISRRITDHLESFQNDVSTFTQFLQFAAAVQSGSRLQSVGPICMCDIWVPNVRSRNNNDEQILVIRLRGGSNLQSPPLRDVAWTWLTLLNAEVLQERYMELCESYCNSFNNTIRHLDPTKHGLELTLYDIIRDLGECFLHGFLTVVHKFTVSGVWTLDRQLHTYEGVRAIADTFGFLIDNGVIGSLFVV